MYFIPFKNERQKRVEQFATNDLDKAILSKLIENAEKTEDPVKRINVQDLLTVVSKKEPMTPTELRESLSNLMIGAEFQDGDKFLVLSALAATSLKDNVVEYHFSPTAYQYFVATDA